MQITATLREDTITRLIHELLPVTIDLDDGAGERWLEIAGTEHLDFVEDVGLRVRTTGRLRWTALGIAIPVTLTSVQLLLRPEIDRDARGGRLLFRPEIETMDLRNVPSLIESPVQGLINQRLAAEGDRLVWHFGESLALAVPLPPEIQPSRTLEIRAPGGTVRVGTHDLSLTIEVELRFLGSQAPPAE